MKTLKQIREQIEVTEAEDKKLTSLIRAGLFDIHKLPLLKRALSKDNTKMSQAERNSLLDLLDTLIAHVTGDQAIFSKVKRNVQNEDINEVYEVAGELPMILILKRRSIRSFPDGQRVALYWADKLKTFISVPYSSAGVGYSPAVSEEVVLVSEEPIEEISKNKANKYISKARSDKETVMANSMARNEYKHSDDFYDDPKDVEDSHRLDRRNKGIDTARSKINKFGKAKVKATEANVEEAKKETSMWDDIDRGKESLRKADAKAADKQKKSNAKLFNKVANKKDVKETLEAIVNENTQHILNFNDGGSTTIGPFTASAIMEVYNAINDDNKAKMKASLNESRAAFNKMAEFALSKV